jgi:hypothetical protein
MLTENSIKILSDGGWFPGRCLNENDIKKEFKYPDIECFPASLDFFSEFKDIKFEITYFGNKYTGCFYIDQNTTSEKLIMYENSKLRSIGYIDDNFYGIYLHIDENKIIYQTGMKIFGEDEKEINLFSEILFFGNNFYECINTLLLPEYYFTMDGIVFNYEEAISIEQHYEGLRRNVKHIANKTKVSSLDSPELPRKFKRRYP